MKSLVYLAKPVYGGWVTFTGHLSKKFNFKIYKVGKRTEINKDKSSRYRDFGYDSMYQNINFLDINKLDNIMITAIDKHYYKYLEYFPNGTYIVIHDPTEVKGKSCQPIIDNLSRFKVITIRKTVQTYLKEHYNIDSLFLVHPFYQYPKQNSPKKYTVSISRLDFDKHTDIILKSNKLLDNNNKIKIFGAKNDLYVYHHLTKKLNLPLDNYHGTFKKDFLELDKILSTAKYVIDLSAIKNDGGGSQYTFLEAIYQDCVLILNDKWLNSWSGNNVSKIESVFIDGINCLVVTDENDIVQLLNTNSDLDNIIKNSKVLLQPHINVDWDNLAI